MTMRVLTRKLVRDLWRLKWQMGAIALLVGCGVSVAVMAFSTEKALRSAQRTYYAQTRFGDIFATATRVPLSIAADLGRIDGVIAVDPRAVKMGLMEVPGLMRPATAHLIALPDDERQALNRIVIVAGRMPDPARSDEAVALKTFLDAAHVALGERLSLVINGHRLTFTVVGSALSAEYVYVPSLGPMPDDAHSGVLWAPRVAVEEPAGLRGAFSAVSLAVAPGTSHAAVLSRVDRLLERYGGIPAYARADQVSHKFQEERIQRLSVMATIFPPVFLIVAAALVHLVLGRMVVAEREQIGLLKAFGYDDRTAAANYVKLAALVAAVGIVAGGLAGEWLERVLVGILGEYMRFPHLESQFSWATFAAATALSLTAAVAGSLGAVRAAVRLSPAVAMQPPTPVAFRRGVVEWLGVMRRLDEPTRMIVRSIERFPLRAVSTWLGLSVSLSLLVGSQFLFGAIDDVVDQAYFRARRWTDQVTFDNARDVHAIAELARLPAVVSAEPYRMVAGRLRGHAREERIAVVGVGEDGTLTRALSVAGHRIPFKGSNLVVSQALAGRLHLQPGDRVELTITDGRRPTSWLRVSAIAQDYAGLTAQVERTALNSIMADGDLASGANLVLASDQRSAFYREIARAPQIVFAGSRDDTVASFRSAVSAVMTTEMAFFFGFAAAITFGIAYNISRIALSDRARDLATLRVLGFGSVECAYILAGELMFLACLAVPAGVLGGFGLARAMSKAMTQADLYLPFVITPHGLAVVFTIYGSAVAVAAALVVQRIWQFDLVAVLKTRD